MKISSIIGVGSNRGWNLVRIAVAVVLLVAAGLKTHQLATEPTFGHSILESRWFLMATVEFELFFGLWLLSGLLPKQTRMAAVGCFATFTCVSLYKAISGEASCGCFGRLPVNPWYTATLDLAIVLSLLRWQPRCLPSPASGRRAGDEVRLPLSLLPKEAVYRAIVVMLTWLAIGLPAGYAMATYTDTTLSNAGEIIGDGKIVVLEPEKWIGKRFPLLDYIDINDKLKEGKWLVLLYHYDCPDCQKAIRDLSRIISGCNLSQMAFVEMPPYKMSLKNVALKHSSPLYARLVAGKEWFASTPVLVALDGGTVVGITGTPNHQFCRRFL